LTTWVSQHQKGYTHAHFNEATDNGVAAASAGQHAIIYTSLETYNHTSTSSLNFFTGRMFFLKPNHSVEAIKNAQIFETNLVHRCRLSFNTNPDVHYCLQ